MVLHLSPIDDQFTVGVYRKFVENQAVSSPTAYSSDLKGSVKI